MLNWYVYILFAVAFILFELAYFYLADKYSIIDHPNERSSHTEVTIRGGGILFLVAVLSYSFYTGFEYVNFLLGLMCIGAISFLDDIFTVSSKLRLFFHLQAVTFLFLELEFFQLPVWFIIIAYVLVIGTINAYNFMDGINGMTGLYSLALIITLIWLNDSIGFINQDLLIVAAIGLVVFLYFNFRLKARCFAGDVGSISMAFIAIFAVMLLIMKTNEFLYILLLAVYGIDTVFTIIVRLFNMENIFDAHRSHTYQILSNEYGISHRLVTLLYVLVQIAVNMLVIYMIESNYSLLLQAGFSISLIMSLVFLYVLARPEGKLFEVPTLDK